MKHLNPSRSYPICTRAHGKPVCAPLTLNSSRLSHTSVMMPGFCMMRAVGPYASRNIRRHLDLENGETSRVSNWVTLEFESVIGSSLGLDVSRKEKDTAGRVV